MTSDVTVTDLGPNQSTSGPTDTSIRFMDSYLATNSATSFPLITSESIKTNSMYTQRTGTYMTRSTAEFGYPPAIGTDPMKSVDTGIVQMDAISGSQLQALFEITNSSQLLNTSSSSLLNSSTHYLIQNSATNQLSLLSPDGPLISDDNIPIDMIETNPQNIVINTMDNKTQQKVQVLPPKTTEITAVLAEEDDEELVSASIADWDTSDITKTVTNAFQCNYCSQRSARLADIRKHIARTHAEDRPYKCSHCDQSFNVELNLRLHISGQHYYSGIGTGDDTNLLKPSCPECSKCFTRLASLKSHLIVHQKEELLSCGQCSQQFLTHYYLNKHIKNVHINAYKRSNGRYNGSTRVLNPTANKPEHTCATCHQKFANNSLLKEHQRLHLKIKSSLKRRTYSRNIDRTGFTHECDTCGKSFAKNCQLVRHLRIHTGEKPFVCEYCGVAFNQKNSLDTHRTKHTGERRYRCRFCSAQFNQSGNMRQHIRRLHAPQVDTPASQLYRCPHCNCVFKKVGILNCHISRRHPLLPLNSSTDDSTRECQSLKESLINVIKDKSSGVDSSLGDLLCKALERSGVKTSNGDKQIAQLFDPATGTRQTHIVRRDGKVSYRQCLYCHKEFKKSSDLVRHTRIHTHDKPFKCCECFRAFRVKGTLSAHLRTHNTTGVRPYTCQICNKSLTTGQSLKVHLRLHTGAQPYSCGKCDKTFRTLALLKSHSISSHKKVNKTLGQTTTARRINSKSLIKKSKQPIKEIDDEFLSKIQLDGPLVVMSGAQVTAQLAAKSNGYDDLTDAAKRKYKCQHCDKAFKKSSHLTQHNRSHTGEKPFRCDQCWHSFVTKGSLKNHMQTHSGDKPFKCHECSYAFSTKGSLTRHMTRHRDVRPFMCPYCQMTFKASLNCKKHIKIHKKEFALQLMSEQQNSDHLLQTNVQVVQQLTQDITQTNTTTVTDLCVNQSDIQLDTNNITTSEVPDVTNHSNYSELPSSVAVDDSTRPFRCDICDVNFKQSSQLRQHISRHKTPNGQQKPFKCDTCAATFASKSSLRRHNNTVHAVAIRKHVCPHCGSRWRTQSALDTHMASHSTPTSDIQSLVDPTCDELVCDDQLTASNDCIINSSQMLELCQQMDSKFVDIRVLNETVATDLPTSPLVVPSESGSTTSKNTNHLNECDFCVKTFKKPSDLVRHRRTHTGEKPYACQTCGKRFTVKSTLDSHLQTHKGVKNYVCDVCSARFATNGSLKVHQRIHTGLKPFVCEECGERFRTSGHRKGHMAKHYKSVVTIASPTVTNTAVIDTTPQICLPEMVSSDIMGGDVLMALTGNQSVVNTTYQMDSALLSQLLQQLDATTLVQQLQSQGFVITTDCNDGTNADSITTLF